jgi:hypothetical protein
MKTFDLISATARTGDGRGYVFSPDSHAAGGIVSMETCGLELTVKRESYGDGELVSAHLDLHDGETFDPDCALELEFAMKDGAWMADTLVGEYWCRPFFGKCAADIPDETQCVVCGGTGSRKAALVVCGDTFRSVIKGSGNAEHRSFSVRLRSGVEYLTSADAPVIAFGCGTTANAAVHAAALCGSKLIPGADCPLREEREYPQLFEYLGWCSWDALQIRVSEAGLIEKADEFVEKGIPVRWAIIDDMWATVAGLNEAKYDSFSEMCAIMHRSALASFKADPERFPNGLKHCIDELKKRGLKVGMWHPATGYWFGIDKDSDLAKQFDGRLMITAEGRLLPKTDLESTDAFYHAWYNYIVESGASFVKVDNQSHLRRDARGTIPIGEAAKNMHEAIERSIILKFHGCMINCMGMAAENMWHRRYSAVSRTSDDFLPENRDWFAKHITQCAYNSLVQGQFYVCDWDMWWTDDSQAQKNAVLRAISGGPVYVSDKIGRSKKELLSPLCLSDGRILRLDAPAVPSEDCISANPETSGRIFKLVNRVGECGVAACFNINRGGAADAELRPSDCGLIYNKEGYFAYDFFSHTGAKINDDEPMKITLADCDDFRLYTIAPIYNGVAVIGLREKYVMRAGLAGVDGRTAIAKEPGTLLVYAEGDAPMFLAKGKILEYTRNDAVYTVELDETTGLRVVIMRRADETAEELMVPQYLYEDEGDDSEVIKNIII